MLERIAVHQTRLRVPGIGLDPRGVALGAKGLVLLPSIDRLIAFLAVYAEEQSIGSLVESLELQVVKSKLNTREIALSFDAGSSDRMDRVSEVSRITGGFTFTGTSRHFVQYRDAGAPFGYDAAEVVSTSASLALYHNTFAQTYDLERALDLKALLVRLMPHPDPLSVPSLRELWVLADAGLGPALLSYFTRANVNASLGIAEWPPESSFDDQAVRRWLFRVNDLPPRMRALLSTTPGITSFVPVTAGAAVEVGFRHPIALEACPVFSPEGLVLLRGRGLPPLEIDRVPVLADVRTLGRAELHEQAPKAGQGAHSAPALGAPVRLMPDLSPPGTVSAILVPSEELPLLRRLAYLATADAIRSIRFALTEIGAFVLSDSGIEGLPLGSFFKKIHASMYVPAGHRIVPPVPSEVLFQALGAPQNRLVFFRTDGSAWAVPSGAFVPLETALVQGQRWAPLDPVEMENAFATEVPTVWLEPLGFRPLKGIGES
jgi:hypothetical protein